MRGRRGGRVDSEDPANVQLCVDHCICIHNVSELMDQLIQYVLYERCQIPEPYFVLASKLPGDSTAGEKAPLRCCQGAGTMSRNESMKYAKLRKFVQAYTQLQHSLRDAFQSRNARNIEEILLVLGGSTLLPKDVYRIRFQTCEEASGCCGPMSLRHIQAFCRSIFRERLSYDFPPIKPTRVSVYLRAERYCSLGDHFQPYLNFKLSAAQANNVNVSMFHGRRIQHPVDSDCSNNSRETSKEENMDEAVSVCCENPDDRPQLDDVICFQYSGSTLNCQNLC